MVAKLQAAFSPVRLGHPATPGYCQSPIKLGSDTDACGLVLQVIPSRDIKVAGLLGAAARVERKDKANVADTEVGLGGTTMWKLCSLDHDTTVAVLFEITSNAKSAARV